MVCPRCGAEMDPNRRYCMKCGALNYDHPDNQKMKQYITEKELEKANLEYQGGGNVDKIEIAGQVYEQKIDKKKSYVDTRASLGLLLVITIVLGVLGYFVFHYSILMTLSIALVYFILSFYILSFISIYMKGGYSGLVPLVPFYSQYAFYDIVLGNGWFFLLLFIPIIGFITSCYANYKLGKVFGKNGVLTLLLPFIMLPVIAFSDRARYQGDGKKYQKYVEKEKRRNTQIAAFVYCIVVLFLFLGLSQTSVSTYLANYFFEYDTNNIVKTIEKEVGYGGYTCDGPTDIDVDDGTYYIEFSDATELFTIPIPVRSSFNGNKLSGYVKVDRVNGEFHYTYAVTDGERYLSTDSNVHSASDILTGTRGNVCKKS